jgi:alpha(1,3/1,4) fucosyltransferase
MKDIKINFKNFFEDFDPENNYFTDTLREKYNVEISDKPDYVFYSVYSKVNSNKDISKKGDFLRKISPKLYVFLRKLYVKLNSKEEKIEAPKGDFVKILYSTENKIPNMEVCDWAISSHHEEKINSPKYFRIPMHLICDYPFHKKTRLPFERKINFNKIKKEKNKFCNFIYSQDINARNDFFKKLNNYKKVDAPGRCMNNMPPLGHDSSKKSRLSKNWVETKMDFLNEYKFTIAFENETADGWTTEKLTHPLLANSIPIYIGNKKVGRDFNTKCFINYNDFKDMKEFIQHIIKVDKDDNLYKQYLEQPLFKNKEQHDFSSHKRVAEKLYEMIESGKR